SALTRDGRLHVRSVVPFALLCSEPEPVAQFVPNRIKNRRTQRSRGAFQRILTLPYLLGRGFPEAAVAGCQPFEDVFAAGAGNVGIRRARRAKQEGEASPSGPAGKHVKRIQPSV